MINFINFKRNVSTNSKRFKNQVTESISYSILLMIIMIHPKIKKTVKLLWVLDTLQRRGSGHAREIPMDGRIADKNWLLVEFNIPKSFCQTQTTKHVHVPCHSQSFQELVQPLSERLCSSHSTSDKTTCASCPERKYNSTDITRNIALQKIRQGNCTSNNHCWSNSQKYTLGGGYLIKSSLVQVFG